MQLPPRLIPETVTVYASQVLRNENNCGVKKRREKVWSISTPDTRRRRVITQIEGTYFRMANIR